MNNRNLLRDWIGIVLALAVGTGGLIFVFSQPDPFTTLPPKIPLLAPKDWSAGDARAGIELGISTSWRWQEKREFQTELEIYDGTYAAGISQIAIWYADPLQAASDWNSLDRASYKGEPFVTSAEGDDRPASLLFCGSVGTNLPEGFRQCWYLAYWKNWYTEINYRSELTEDLHLLEMRKIAVRVDQLLMSAPEEPCYGIICTSTESGVKP